MRLAEFPRDAFPVPALNGLLSPMKRLPTSHGYAIFLSAFLLLTPAMAAESKPNVLFIAIDDLRPELGCYGAKHIQSPNIDKLASGGLLFERAYCQQAVCNPSRASVLSGCRPDTTRVMANNKFLRPMMPDVVTLPQHFKANGWHSLSLGKIFHHSEGQPGDDAQSWSEPSWYHGAPYRHWFTNESNDLIKQLKKQGSKLSRGPPFEAADEPDESYPDAQTATKAIEMLQRLKEMKKPFFLGVGFVKPHLPFTCPQKYWDMYPAESIKLPDNYAPTKDAPEAAFHDWYELRTYGRIPAKGGISDDTARDLIRGYRACVSFMDAQVGRVLAELDRLGLRENTVVVLWGDHGYHLGENGVFTKMTNFELGARVPLIVSAPGQKTTGQRTRALVELVDLYPTLAELAGLPRPAHLEGTSFAPLLAEPERAWKPAAFSQYLRPGPDGVMGRSIRTDRWRYTEWTTAKGARVGTELYDEQRDSAENTNIAGDAKSAEVVAQLAQQLQAGWKAALPVGPRADVILGAFDGGSLDGWTATGDAFSAKPFQPGTSGRFTKFEGAGIAWSGRGGFAARGTLVSPEFEIQRRFISFLIAGHRDYASQIGAELLVDGRVVRAAGATEAQGEKSMYWRTWDVGAWAGKRAQIRVNDNTDYGALAVDHFIQSDERKAIPSDATTRMQETHRPQFHYTARAGWTSDSDGLVHYKGQWHMFHQHVPPGSPVTVWGHAVSTDLMHWQHRPVALPGEGEASIYSGSGLADWENRSGLKQGSEAPLLFFYTLRPPGAVSVTDGKGEKSTQCLAYSLDGGQTFQKFAGNPILTTKDFRDRDPKVFWHAPTSAWIMVLSLSRNNADRENATYGLFRSKDLKSWELVQEVGPGAWYWECPDMFELPIDGDPARTKWLLVRGSGDYILGSFDGHRFAPETGIIKTQWGGNFYAAQSFHDAPGGRRVQIAPMLTGKERVPGAYPGMPFNQQMSFPREWRLCMTPEGPRVFRQPIAEIAQLYTKTHEMKPRTLEPGDNALADIRHDLLDLELEIELKGAKQVKLALRGEEIVYDVKDKKLKAFGRALPLAPTDGKLILRALLDRTSIELFGNRGEVTHSGVFFADPANQNLALTVEGGPAHMHRLVVHELKSIWPAAP